MSATVCPARPGVDFDLDRVKVVRAYDAAADRYDSPPLAFWARHGAATIERLGLAEGASVLDVGCGSGASAFPAAAAVGPRGRILGIDLSQRLLERARRKAALLGLGNVSFRKADMTASGLPDESFDAVVCVFAIFFAPDMARQVAELWRLVRPGGKLAITTWGPELFEPGSHVWWRSVERERPDLHAAFNPWDRIVTPESVRLLLQQGGVPDPVVVAQPDVQPLAHPEDWWTVIMGSGHRGTVEMMGAAAVARVRDANLRFIRENAVREIQTNAIYACASKPTDDGAGGIRPTGLRLVPGAKKAEP